MHRFIDMLTARPRLLRPRSVRIDDMTVGTALTRRAVLGQAAAVTAAGALGGAAGTDWPFTGAIFAVNADERWPWFGPLLPRGGDPQPALRSSFSLRERSAIERSTALDLYPRVAARP